MLLLTNHTLLYFKQDVVIKNAMIDQILNDQILSIVLIGLTQ